MRFQSSISLLALALTLVQAQWQGEEGSTTASVAPPPASAEVCTEDKHEFNPFIHKKVYTVGVHATRGLEMALTETNQTFATYLTETAGKRFDPPIRFQVVPYFFDGLFQAIENDEMDFLYANPGVYSCIGTEVGATALVTAVKRLPVRDKTYDLDVYGGVIAVRADNKEINSIADLKDKVIGAGAIVDLMGGQVQIYEMEHAGMSYVNDPKQLIFTKNQIDIVYGILSGRFDVGFIRTDQIEITKDEDGKLLDPDLFKIIEPKIYVMDDGDLFPFLHSTDIFPEWPLAALDTVPADVALEVQEAMLSLQNYAIVGDKLQECRDFVSTTADECEAMHPHDFHAEAPCDTTWDLAEAASAAAETGLFAGFRTARSYFELRSMQQEAGFMVLNDEGKWHCTRPSNLYEGITCPEGYFKRSEEEFLNGCGQVGLSCDENEDYDCFCKPCVLAFDVDVYQHITGEEDLHLVEYYGEKLPGCHKMDNCGTVQQGQSITLRIFDNVMRDDATVTVIVHAGDEEKELPVVQLEGTYAYEVNVSDTRVQVQVIEVAVNGKPISQSPIRVIVVDADCSVVNGHGTNRVANDEGQCVCANNTYIMFGTCVDSAYFFLIIFTCVFFFLAIIVTIFLGYKRKQSDSVWHVTVDELHFNEPPEIVGQGAFGVVVLGQYRGTKVAVKRVLPPQSRNGSASGHFSGSVQLSGEYSHKPRRGTKPTANDAEDKEVKFHGDVEAQEPRDVKGRGSVSMSNKAWEALLLDSGKYNSALKILESATMSNHGSVSMLDGEFASSKGQSHFLTWLPFWMRFDENSKLRAEFLNEMRLLSRLRHPCITTVMGAVISPRVDPMLVMEYMEYGSLYDLLRNETMYAGGDLLLQIVRDISSGIQFLHASKPPILHGDLKAKNILVDSRFRAKVADFGFSHLKTSKVKNVLQGTPYFMAPEYLRRKSEYTTQCDIYSLGMIFYEIYARQDPFEGEDPRKVLPKVCHPRVNKRPPVPAACPPKMADIMKKCWAANQFFRPTAKDIDYILVEMSSLDAEPLEQPNQETFKDGIKRKPTSLYDVFPKHIADALNAGKRVEPESHEIVTVVFSDIVGFTSISQTFTPLKVSDMLDRLYRALDDCARKHNVFKVETIGDAYMGVTNIEGNQHDTHVKDAAEFAVAIVNAAAQVLVDVDAPGKGYVKMRVGFHSGPVVSNVIGSLNPRYGLFGDTVNTASRMESNSVVGRIHCTFASAQLLMTQAPELPVTLRGKILVKGKGKMMTYWVGNTMYALPTIPDHSESILADTSSVNLLDIDSDDEDDEDNEDATVDDASNEETGSHRTKETERSSISESPTDSCLDDERFERKINVISDVLLGLLKEIVATRPANATTRDPLDDQIVRALEKYLGSDKTPLEEASEFIALPQSGTESNRDPKSIALSGAVQHQMHSFVEIAAKRHRSNTFHNFDHAVHVAMAAQRFLGRFDSATNNVAFGLTADKLSQFGLVFACLVHDIDHRGVPNFCLAQAEPSLHEKYDGKATQEQHSFLVGWEVLMGPDFDQLRACIYQTKEELIRFRQVVAKAVLATEIFDPKQTQLRQDRWESAFGNTQGDADSTIIASRKANVIMELLIQGSDVAHTMQNWNKYVLWNRRLFQEMYKAFTAGYLEKDPSVNWFESEKNFFDSYVMPLASRLQETAVFGLSGEDCLRHAKRNRKQWEQNGESLVNSMMIKNQTGHKIVLVDEPASAPVLTAATAG